MWNNGASCVLARSRFLPSSHGHRSIPNRTTTSTSSADAIVHGLGIRGSVQSTASPQNSSSGSRPPCLVMVVGVRERAGLCTRIIDAWAPESSLWRKSSTTVTPAASHAQPSYSLEQYHQPCEPCQHESPLCGYVRQTGLECPDPVMSTTDEDMHERERNRALSIRTSPLASKLSPPMHKIAITITNTPHALRCLGRLGKHVIRSPVWGPPRRACWRGC